jgi:hypothetical protein
MHGFTIVSGNSAMPQFLAAFAARHGADAHAAFFARVYCHSHSPV